MEPSYCSFCLQPESFLLIVAVCKPYLNDGLYFWQHNSALSFVAQIVQSKQSAKLYVDLPGYLSPVPFINGNNLRPDILLSTTDHTLYNIELTMGLEINYAENSAHCKELEYRSLLTDLVKDCNKKNEFVSLCSSCFDIFGDSSDSLRQICNERGIENRDLRFIIHKSSKIIIPPTYY